MREAGTMPVEFGFTGTVTDVPVNETTVAVSAGDAIVGTYTFESTTADGAARPEEGSYTSPAGAPYGLSVTVALAGSRPSWWTHARQSAVFQEEEGRLS